jgi:hypothetical protein
MAPEYNLDIQARIPVALCAIHNFIRIHDTEELVLDDPLDQDDNTAPDADGVAMALEVQEEPGSTAAIRRDRIAQDMWEDYQRILAERGTSDADVDSSGTDDNSDEPVASESDNN